MRGIVRPLADGGVVRAAGTKAVSLSKLDRWGFTIPAGWYLPFSVHDGYRAEGRSAVDGLRDELRTVLDPRRAYAVRSAADIEDARDG